MEARQLLPDVTATAALPASTSLIGRNCGGLNLPVGGVISMPNGEFVTLTAAAAFKPVCTPVTPPAIIANGGGGSVTIDDAPDGSMPTDDGWTYSDFRDPFYASTFPQCYALAATTVVAYTLVIMLFITPRSFLDGGVVVLGRRGFTNGGSGPTIGGRPWLQKVAALSVAISLTIASAATFDAAEEQYSFGVQNAKRLQMEVLGGNELKIIRIISNTFLWLAQAQTLIRLFPRQREKVIIKWTAFALITLDIIFQSLNSFQYTEQGVTRPGSFQDAVPALSYLFALSLGVLYAAWVIYYSLLKKRYAFWHPRMKNMCLVAVLSLLSILIPVVFFILDISKPEFTGWGEYVRWVGAAAASVIVWEWVERIEALEREEKKDGILGREVFDGDEMVEMTPAGFGLRKRPKGGGEGGKGPSVDSGRDNTANPGGRSRWPMVTAIAARYGPRSRQRKPAKPADPTNTQSTNNDRLRFLQPPLWPVRPPPAVTPVSRTDSASAASTVYAIRYHSPTETTSRTPPPAHSNALLSRSNTTVSRRASEDESPSDGEDAPTQHAPSDSAARDVVGPSSRWQPPLGPPRRTRPSDEERAVPTASHDALRKKVGGGGSSSSSSKWDLRTRLEEFAATQAERLWEKFRTTPDTDSLPVTVIPAPPRRGAALAQLLEEEERELQAQRRAHLAREPRNHGTVTAAPAPPPAPAGDASPSWRRPQLVRRSSPGSFVGTSRRPSVQTPATPASPWRGPDDVSVAASGRAVGDRPGPSTPGASPLGSAPGASQPLRGPSP